METRIALAGNPNSGKTTLFNALTGSNQYVGNWPGVTVEKKEGKLKGQENVVITDLPGIYSLSPYTLEEVVARNYLIGERPDAILNVVDGTNLERNLYLTTQLTELGIPVVVAINMMDLVRKNGDKINIAELSRALGCKVVEISALKGTGIREATEAAVNAAENGRTVPMHTFSGAVEYAIAHIKEAAVHNMPQEQQRWYAIKIFERDKKVMAQLNLSSSLASHIEADIQAAETECDDDAESIITDQRYLYIASLMKCCYKKKRVSKLSPSDQIDRVVTNRFLALPIFAIVMFLVYYVSVTTVGTWATEWANDGVFGNGWHLFGIGTSAYKAAAHEFGGAAEVVDAFLTYAVDHGMDSESVEAALDTSKDYDPAAAEKALNDFAAQFHETLEVSYPVEDEETLDTEEVTATGADLMDCLDVYAAYDYVEPHPGDYGIWIPGVPVIVGNVLEAVNCADWLQGLILDGIVAGVGAVLGFVPQMLVLFIFLAFLEGCGYMARVAFIMDRVFRKFGLSGKSFIPILIGTGCGVPGIMASRTIENERDRRMTIITTTFIPCGAKMPFIGMMAGAIFGRAAWVAASAYFMGIAAIVCSGIILKKTRLFSGDPAPFVMELPAYHLHLPSYVLRSMWERGWSFIQRAGTVILLSTVLVWFATYFGFVDGTIRMLAEEELNCSILARIGSLIAWIFKPQGWGNWQAAVASITGLVAKENIVGTMGVLYTAGEGTAYQNMAAYFNTVSGYSFMAFNLLCAPCFAAIGAIRREMNSSRWTWFAVAYQCGFAYLVSLVISQLGGWFIGTGNILGTVISVAVVLCFFYLLMRPDQEATRRDRNVNSEKKGVVS